jgi:hypothetical protein
VLDVLRVRLYCSANVVHPSGDSRTYWSTESRYPYSPGVRKDMVEIDLGGGKVGMGQIISFIEMNDLPEDAHRVHEKLVLIRWMSVSTLSSGRDDCDRPLCCYPLSSNHCLWQWSDTGRDRQCFTRRGFQNNVDRQKMWNHVPHLQRRRVIQSEIRARYDVISYQSILRHANTMLDPTSGHMLQTIQMI